MFRRLWLVLAVGWAALMLWLTTIDQSGLHAPQPMWWVMVFGPMAVPWILSRLVTFVRFGSFRRPIPAPWRPYRRF